MTQPEPRRRSSDLTWPEAFLALGALVVVGVVILGFTWMVLR